MRTFMWIYSILMIAISIFTLAVVPRALKDLGQERQRLASDAPGTEFNRMVEAGYRLNSFILLIEIFYYYLLLRYAGPEWQFLYGGFFFGVIHILYLIFGRMEKMRLIKGSTSTGFARFLIWSTTLLTIAEFGFLIWVVFLLLGPAPGE